MTVTLPFPVQPAKVRAVPVGTVVSSEWKDGVLRLGFETLQSHAAVIVDADVAAPLPLLPMATASNPARFHPAGANFLFTDGFEDTAPGSPPDKPWLAWNRNGTAITVTKDVAASGKRSLRFTEPRPTWPDRLGPACGSEPFDRLSVCDRSRHSGKPAAALNRRALKGGTQTETLE